MTKALWEADLGNGYYRNPILYGDYSDPDVIRVGDDYYMIASSFTYVPGIPVLHSKDLIHWETINYVVREIPEERYKEPQQGSGMWAPSLRYHDGKFWMFVGDPDAGIYMSNTEDIYGEWSPLHLVRKGQGLIDTCPFWDEDGQAYLVHAYANSRSGIKHKIALQRMTPDGRATLGEDVIIYDGTVKHPTIEGPKMYKRNGYYYIFAPAGGVETGWQVVLRSDSVWGPYGERTILESGDSGINGPHQGGWVDTPDGKDWFIHFQDRGAYGRITHLQPMHWEKDWPILGNQGEPVKVCRKPVDAEYKVYPQTDDSFESSQLGIQWQWQANPCTDWYRVGGGVLHLANVHAKPMYEKPNVLTQLMQAPEFAAQVHISMKNAACGERAGIGILNKTNGYIALEKTEKGIRLVCTLNDQDTESQLLNSESAQLRVIVHEGVVVSFAYLKNGQWKSFGKPFAGSSGSWTGSKVFLFGSGEGQGVSEFREFKIKKAE